MRKVLCSIFSIAMILSIPSAVLALDFVDSSIPNTMVSSYEKGNFEIPKELEDIGDISVAHCAYIDGVQYELYATFDEPERALKKIENKCEALIKTLQNKYSLLPFGDNTWIDYRNAMYNLLDDDSCPTWYNESHPEFSTLDTFFDIYENKYDNDKILKMIDDYATSKSRSVKANICEEIFSSLPYTSLEKNSEDYFAELSAARAGFNKNAGINYATKYATNRNTSEYHSFTNGDCANFASQILEKGGVAQVVYSSEYSGWGHTKTVTRFGTIHKHSRSWTQADTFARYMGVGYKTKSNASFSANIVAGDFIAIDKASDGSWDHIGFVVATKSTKTNGYYDYKVAQHTSDYLAWASSSTNNWENQGANGATYGRVRR